MSRKYNKTFTSLKTVVHDTSILDAQKILVKVPNNSFEERTDIIDYINVSDENIKTEINGSINNTNENIDTINTILGNKIFESSEKSTATTLIDWDAIHYKDTTTVPHNTDIVLITLIPQNTNISVKTYLAAWYVNSSDEKTWLGMSDNAITWEEGKKATWTFLNNPLNIPDNCRLELFLTTSILNNPSGGPNHPGVYFASKASDNKQATHRYENYWDGYGGTPYTIFNSSSLISNEEATNKFADKAITETTLGEIGYIYELAADATGDGECDAIHYAANKIPHNIVIDEIRIPTLNNSPKPLYLAVWIINQSDVKTYIGLSDSTATWSEGGTATWKFTNNPITVPENYKLELFLAETAPASGANSTPVSNNYIKTYVNYSGSGTVRHGGTWYSGRDIRTIFVKNGIVVNHETRITNLEENGTNKEEIAQLQSDVSELQSKNYAYTDAENVFSSTNTFEAPIHTNNIIVDNGAIEFTDDGEVILSNGASGWPYTIFMPDKFENGKIYDLGLLTSDVDLSGVAFDGDDTIVQTAEIWFTLGDTIYDIIWPANVIWIDTIDGTMPLLTANLNYRLSIRKEVKYIVASISYTFKTPLI